MALVIFTERLDLVPLLPGLLEAIAHADAGAVARRLDAAVPEYLGLPLDYSCWVEIDNTNGASDLVLAGNSAAHGTYVVGPPAWIGKGTVARLVLQDPKPNPFGSDGAVAYTYSDANLKMKTVTFSYRCPTVDSNQAASTQPDWACFAKSGDPNSPWSQPVPAHGNPLFVGFVTGGGKPR
jgi:hypothetical protein